MHEETGLVDSPVDKKILGLLFWIRLRAASQGCRNLLRTSARESGTGTESRIRTVRQLAAAAGDGWLGSVGSPGQLETSLNSGYTVGPCNSYLEGPTLSLFGLAARASRARHPPVRRRSQRKERLRSLLLRRRRAICRRSQPRRTRPPTRRARFALRKPTLAATVRSSGPARRPCAATAAFPLGPAIGPLAARPTPQGRSGPRPNLARTSCARCRGSSR